MGWISTAGQPLAAVPTRRGWALLLLILGLAASPASAQYQFAPGGTPGFSAIPRSLPAPAPVLRGDSPRQAEPRSPHLSLPAIPRGKVALALAARFGVEGAVINSGLHWRVFSATDKGAAQQILVAESRDAAPIFALDPGAYVVHAGYGLAGIARRIVLTADPVRETFAMRAGALRLLAVVGNQALPTSKVSFDIYANSLVGGAPERLLVRNVESNALVLLPEGTYQIASSYGDANATVRADVAVVAGRISEATLRHRAASVTLKLVEGPGGNALPDTAWSVVTPAGDVIKEMAGAFPSMVLQAGDYVVMARHEGRTFSREFSIEAGRDKEVEVTTKDVAANPAPSRPSRRTR